MQKKLRSYDISIKIMEDTLNKNFWPGNTNHLQFTEKELREAIEELNEKRQELFEESLADKL